LFLTSMRDGFAATVERLDTLLADPGLEPALRHQVEPQYALALFYNGRSKEGHAFARRIRPGVPLRDESDQLALGVGMIIGLETGEDWADFEVYMQRTLREGVRANDHVAAGLGARGLAGLDFYRGRYLDAGRWLAEAEVQFEQTNTLGMLTVVRAIQ